MSQVQAYGGNAVISNSWIEQVILQLADAFDIRVVVLNPDTAIITGALALAGALLGGFAGGRMGAVLGAGIAGANGLRVFTSVPLREIWDTVKEKLKELFFVVVNYLRGLDPVDCVRAIELLMDCESRRHELVLIILKVVTSKLGKEVISSITAA